LNALLGQRDHQCGRRAFALDAHAVGVKVGDARVALKRSAPRGFGTGLARAVRVRIIVSSRWVITIARASGLVHATAAPPLCTRAHR
jgi:hypothetical protein